MNEHSPNCPWHQDWHRCDCGAFDSAEHLAKEISQMSDKEVEDNVEKFFGTKMKGICDACGRETEVDVIKNSNLVGVSICEECSQPNKERTMDKKKVIEELENAFYIGRLSNRERQIENSLHFTAMMLKLEEGLYSLIREAVAEQKEEKEDE